MVHIGVKNVLDSHIVVWGLRVGLYTYNRKLVSYGPAYRENPSTFSIQQCTPLQLQLQMAAGEGDLNRPARSSTSDRSGRPIQRRLGQTMESGSSLSWPRRAGIAWENLGFLAAGLGRTRFTQVYHVQPRLSWVVPFPPCHIAHIYFLIHNLATGQLAGSDCRPVGD